jgi:hypothetical protein
VGGGIAEEAVSEAAPAREAEAGERNQQQGQEEEAEEEDTRTLRETLAQLDRQTRYQIAVLAGGTCVMSLSFGTVSPILPLFASQWGELGATGVGLVLSAPALAKLALNHASGRRADTHGRVPMMVAGGLISAAGNACTGDIPSCVAAAGAFLCAALGWRGSG